MKKQLAIIGAVAAIGAAGVTGVAVANAATTGNRNDHMSSLVDALANKFNLNKSDVKAVFDANREQMQAQHEQEIKDKIAQLVKDGKLTQAQADALNAKRAELQKEREANRTADQDLTRDQRKAKMDERRTALEAWLKEQGIDAHYRYLLMGGHGHGHGGPDGMRANQ
ncbi:hypothetical protein KA093_01165 [Candidatus Saccharibacteria bacterium]|nr:hypothetical protein [Candidatus Saccharibacteria bacterium]